MEISCCFQTLGCLTVVVIFIYRMLRLPKSDPSLYQSFLRKETSSQADKKSSPTIIAHRGGSAEAPENTLAAFRMAKENGADGVEFDVDFTKDGKAVVIHDSTVDRTTNGKGLVSDYNFEELRQLDASCKHPLSHKFPKEKIPTLEEVVELCSSLGLKMLIEIKKGTNTLETALLLKNLFLSYQLYDKALVCSCYPTVIYQIRKTDPKVITALVWWRDSCSYIVTGGKELHEIDSPTKVAVLSFFDRIWETLLPWYYDFLGIPIFSCGKEHVHEDMLEMWNGYGVGVVTWTVNHAAAKDYFMECLDCPVITDCVRHDSQWN
ncbi:glycerophosphodiester phosphodiesterase 1-like [Montipora foliosa]|uniref:glycerophosphodiester phosphodiesterase 1-like n=1 Tax=Montipora foliosa TaxID=591990 RepID=UPI0035F15635